MNILLRKYIVPLSAAVMLPFSAAAQDLNPTVEVSREYRGTLMDLDKPSVDMALPDSVLRFNLQFDYSVFDSPFKGAYEFRPFLMDMDIAPGYSGERKFYLRAGAGYSLHPELDLVWSPVRNDMFRLSLYARHRSYVGNYRALGLDMSSDEAAIRPTGARFSGHDLLTEAGVAGSLDWETGIMNFRAGYYGTALMDTTVTRGYDGLELDFGVASKHRVENHFVYDVDASYRYAEDKFTYSGAGRNFLTEHDLTLSASLGGAFGSGHSFLLGLGLDYALYGAVFNSDAGNVTMSPRYLYSGGIWNVDLGVKFAFLFSGNRAGNPVPMNMARGQVIYPDITVSLSAIRKYMDVYLTVGGGPDINRYSSVLDSEHHVTPLYNMASGAPLLDNTVERISFSAGIRGNIASRFRYDLSAGYRNFGSAPLPTVTLLGERMYAGIAYSPWQMFFTRLDFSWMSQDVSAGGWIEYRSTDVAGRNSILFAPSALSGYVDVMYNWKKRIFFGADCGFSTARYGSVAVPAMSVSTPTVIPGYADLGVKFEYAFTRKFSLWVRGGNLLDMTIQKTPLYSESGIYFTAGICLNL